MIASVGKPLNTSTGSLHFDISRSPGLQDSPQFWPSDDEAEMLENFVNPETFLAENRPLDIE
jgi:hypothetical protein